MATFTPNFIKNKFFETYSNITNYKNLVIKKNATTKELEKLYDSNILNLKTLSEELQTKNEAENNDYYNTFINKVYLLDFKNKPKLKPIDKDKFLKYEYKEEKNTKRTEINYISTYNNWIKNIFQDESNNNNLSWIVLNQNNILLELLQYRSNKNSSVETFRADLKLLLKFIKLADGERSEMVNKYKLLNKTLTKINDMRDKENKLTPLEETKFISYPDLLTLRQNIYNKWFEEYNEAVNKQNIRIRTLNIHALMLSFYSLIPPMRLEPLALKIINKESEAEDNIASILIKDDNIYLYFNEEKKKHKPIKLNINDKILKEFSKPNINTLISDIKESIELYPREYLFINTKNELYKEKTIQKLFYELLDNKNLGVNAFRSIYISYYFNKLSRLQLERVAAFMRSSVTTLHNSYFKQGTQPTEIKKEDDEEDENIIKSSQIKVIKKITPEQKQLKDEKRADYQSSYYQNRREELLQKNKEHQKTTYWMKYCYRLNKGLLNFDQVKKETLIKYKINYNPKKDLYYSLLDPEYKE